MTIGIYVIEHVASGKRYVGKSVNIEARFWAHKNLLTKESRSKDCNRHLFNAVKKHGIDAFLFRVIESFDSVDERR